MNLVKLKILNAFFVLSLIILPQANHAVSNKAFANDDKLPAEILYQINQYRLSKHLPMLKMDPVISAEAKKHSLDMANHRMAFGHQDFNTRIKHIYAKLPNCRGGAENIAYNYKNAVHVVSEWVKSKGHQRNIVGAYNLTGIGIARDKKGKIYFTQLFIRN